MFINDDVEWFFFGSDPICYERVRRQTQKQWWEWNDIRSLAKPLCFVELLISEAGLDMDSLDYVLKNKNSSNFTRDANWPPNHKTYFGFALPCLWNVIIHFLIWCGWLGSGQIGRFLTGIITFHRPGRAKCKKCFVVRESMCISGEIQGIFGFSKRNLLPSSLPVIFTWRRP